MSRGTSDRFTYPVSDDVFRVVYDSPAALPGAHRWVTPDADVRKLEGLLGIPAGSVGAPLWVSAIVELDTGAVERVYEDTLPAAASSPLGTTPPLNTDEEYRLNRAARAELIRRRVISVTGWRDIE